MSSPFLTPGQSRQRRVLAARQRRRRRVVSLAAVCVLALGAIGALAFAGGSSGHRGPRTGHAAAHGVAVTSAPALSADGLTLARPALALGGLSTPAADPVRVSFHSPPRAGLLFNLSTGQVLWQRNADKRLRIASLTKMMTALVSVRSAPPGAPVLVTHTAIESGGSKVGVLPLGRRVRL